MTRLTNERFNSKDTAEPSFEPPSTDLERALAGSGKMSSNKDHFR